MNEFDKQIKAKQSKNLRHVGLVLGLAGAGFALYLLWLFLAQGYKVVVLPEEAKPTHWLQIDSGSGWIIGDTVYTLGGEVMVTADAAKFEPKQVKIGQGSPRNIEVILEPSPGTIVFNTQPALAQTQWFLDGALIHVGESLSHQTPPGQYDLHVKNEYYLPLTTPVEVKSEEEVSLSQALEKVQGRINVTSTPLRAKVFVDGRPYGKTPIAIPLEGGAYEVKVVGEGFEDSIDEIKITHEAPHPERHFLLEPKKAALAVSAEPADGLLTLDGAEVSLGTLRFSANRPHILRYQKPGYFAYTREITLKPDDFSQLNIQLKPEFGQVRVNANVVADVYINGQNVGKTPYSQSLPALSQRIELRKNGYRSVMHKVIPTSSKAIAIDAELLTEFDARRKEGRPLFVNTLGMKLSAFRPNAFVMGSPPNEKGRRRNEFQIPVDFSRRIWVGQHEVTEAQYRAFDASVANSSLPVTNISWLQAAAYCNWLSENEGLPPFYRIQNGRYLGVNRTKDETGSKPNNGYRLLTEAEWEWLARKSKRAAATVFPWGNQERIPKEAGNFADQSMKGSQTFVLPKYNDGFTTKAPVGSFKKEKSGVFDMAGNVSEWVHDSYTNQPADTRQAKRDYLGAKSGTNHVVKGANFKSGRLLELRTAYRHFAEQGEDTIGFRIARYDQ